MSDFVDRLRGIFGFKFKIGDVVAYMDENGNVFGVPFIVESYDFFGGIRGTSVYGEVYAHCKTFNGYELKKMADHAKTVKAKIVVNGNCCICGKPLDSGLFLCKKCAEHAEADHE